MSPHMLNAGCHELTTKCFVHFFGKRQAIWPFSRWCAKTDYVPDHSWRRAWNVFLTLHWTSWSVLTPLALVIRPQHRLRASLLCSDLLGRQTKTTLNQVFQPCDEVCGWSPIDDIMIQTDCQTQVLPDGFSLMPPRVRKRLWGVAKGMPQPLPLPNIPTAVIAHVPPLLFR